MIAVDSPFFLDYSDYVLKNKDKYPEIVNFQGFERIESFYTLNNFDSPVVAWLH